MPCQYSPALAQRICARLAAGDSLRTICADADMPNRETVRRWGARRPEFREALDGAGEVGADFLAAEALAAARQVTPANASATRVLLNELHWQAARLEPKEAGAAPETGFADRLEAALKRAERKRAERRERG